MKTNEYIMQKKIKVVGVLLLALIMSCKQEEAKKTFGRPLFNGENLEGWTQKGGNAD